MHHKNILIITKVIYFLIINYITLATAEVDAQVIPDSTLGNESSQVINAQVNGLPSEVITGGASRGKALFHSFQLLKISAGKQAYFSNPRLISNIIARVTGASPSSIDGVLGVLGNANLFLLSPQGIIFGSNASLDLNGSFFATTAQSLRLSDKYEFSARNPQVVPDSIPDTPTALVFSHPSAPIYIQGKGHSLSPLPTQPNPYFLENSPTIGLDVPSGQTLAIIGGNISFDGGVVNVLDGNVDVGSIGKGEVKITKSPKFGLDYSQVEYLQDISLDNLSLINGSSTKPTNINLKGHNINLTNGSYVFAQYQGEAIGGQINIDASNLLRVSGEDPPFLDVPASPSLRRSSVQSQNLIGKGPDLLIKAKNIDLQRGGSIASASLISGRGGNILVEVTDTVSAS